jgi:hypothetical protein
MASLFYLPWAIVRDVAGVGIPGAQVYFTQTSTNTKKSVYQDSGLVTPHTNPVICDGVGNPPITYLDPTVSYRVRVYDRDAEAGVDTPIKDIDPYVPGIFADATALQPVADDAANSASAATNSAAVAATAATEAAASAASAAAAIVNADAALVAIEATVATSGFTLAQLASSGLPLNVKWFGATGNGTTNDSAAILAAIAYAKTIRVLGYGYAEGGGRLYFPKGVYNCGSTTIEWDFPLFIEGDFASGPAGGGSVLTWTADVTGIKVKVGAGGSLIQNLLLKGAYPSVTPTESEAHGIDLWDKATIRDIFIDGFAGNGIHCDTFNNAANCNGAEIHHPLVQNCRNGIYLEGSDANGVHITCPQLFVNRRYGIWIKNTIGEGLIAGGVYELNGYYGPIPCAVTYSGNHYYCLPGQEVGASTNAPSGTTANNTWWGYHGAGAVDTGGFPTWVSGMTIRSGGVMRIEGGSSFITVCGGYQEPGYPPAVSKIDTVQVVSNRKTGWSVDTGTAKRTANATYSGTAEGAYTQATVQALMDAVRDMSQTIKALKDDLHSTAGHGLIGT